MPGAIVHLLVAKQVMDSLPALKSPDMGQVYAGVLGPDAIHAKADYQRQDKKATHLRQGIMDGDFHKDSKQEIFRSRLAAFVDQHIHGGKNDLDWYIGYYIHLVTDEVFLKTIRPTFIDRYRRRGYPEDPNLFKLMRDETRAIEAGLSQKSREKEGIIRLLQAFDRDPSYMLLNAEMLRRSREWTLETKLLNPTLGQASHILLEADFLSFIEVASQEVTSRLKKILEERKQKKSLLYVSGPPCAGKSSVSKALVALDIDLDYIYGDDAWSQYPDMDFNDRLAQTNEDLLRRLKSLSSPPLLLEWVPSYGSFVDQMKMICHERDIDFHHMVLTAPRPVLEARKMKRDNNKDLGPLNLRSYETLDGIDLIDTSTCSIESIVSRAREILGI